MTTTTPRRAPVMHDVALVAGVSHQTVSRVLNHHPGVRAETRARVEQVVRDMGYRRNAAARTLVTRASSVLGVVAAGTTLFGPASTLLAIERAARRRGYAVTVASLADLSPEAVSEAFGYLDELGVAGVVVIAPQRTAADTMLRLPHQVPVVAVDGGLDADLPIVRVDQAAGARLMTEHLLQLGHRTVHHVAGPADWLEAEERVAGWQAALLEAGRPVPPLLRGDWTAARGHLLGGRLVHDPTVTAVFAANDHTALGLLRAFQEAGRRVPEDVSVGGFDDIPEAPFLGPALTSVRQGFASLGEVGIATLLEMVDGGRPPVGRTPGRTTAPELMVRSSTGPPSAAHRAAPLR